MNITLPFPVPKKNSRVNTRQGRSFPNARYVRWHKLAATLLANQLGKNLPSVYKCETIAVFYAPDKRKRDLTNLYQSVEDLFNDIGLWTDDNYYCQRSISLFFGGVDKENPRVEVGLFFDADTYEQEFLHQLRTTKE